MGRNVVLIAGFLSIRAEAVRLDSLRWARYGFGHSDGTLAREQALIASIRRFEEP